MIQWNDEFGADELTILSLALSSRLCELDACQAALPADLHEEFRRSMIEPTRVLKSEIDFARIDRERQVMGAPTAIRPRAVAG